MTESPSGLVLRDLRTSRRKRPPQPFDIAADWFESATGNPSGPADVQSLYYALPDGADPATKELLVVELDGAVIGIVDVVAGHPAPANAACGLFLVDPAIRGQGVGTTVDSQLIRTARSRGIELITVTVPRSQERGRCLLNRLGFDVEPLCPRVVADNRTAWPGEQALPRAELRL